MRDAGQVCLNGHPINPHFNSRPDRNEKFCSKCGSGAIAQCPTCNHAIQGHSPDIFAPFKPASFCHNCGKPYPWTEKKMTAAKELVDGADGLDQKEKEALTKSVD